MREIRANSRLITEKPIKPAPTAISTNSDGDRRARSYLRQTRLRLTALKQELAQALADTRTAVRKAWERLDRLLDRAVPVGLDTVTIVHGMGEGRLRAQLLKRLKADSRVERFHPAGERQQNLGATVVYLR